jgi:flagellin
MSAVGSILTNSGALDALNALTTTTNTNNTLENELSTGLAISSPADNPAGYITAQGFTSQLNGITQAISNANQGVSLLQTAQGAVTQQISVVQQLNSIAVEAANGTQTPEEGSSLQDVVSQLTAQVSTIAKQTQFNDISLLNGTFSGVQFQVGANEGQTQTLTIGNLSASAIGLNATAVISSTAANATKAIYKTGSASDSGVVTKGAAGAFTAGTLKITGPTAGAGSVSVKASESAASISSAVNDLSGTTGVQAQATTTVTLKLTNAGTASGYAFTVGAGTSASANVGESVKVDGSNIAELITQINGQTSTNGITASQNSAGSLVLTQSSGDNILFSNASSGVLTTTGTAVKIGSAANGGSAKAVVQGQVQFQSSAAFSVGNASAIGLGDASTLSSLSDINVSTTAGANAAINVVKYALAALNNTGGQLGAVQQSLTANINNLDTTSQNVTSALGVVQDANIPAVSTSLTEAEIQAQSGVAALKSSTTLQQAYLSLLP